MPGLTAAKSNVQAVYGPKGVCQHKPQTLIGEAMTAAKPAGPAQ